MISEDKSWSMSSKDPHLMRLGHYLAWVERDAGWTWEDMDYLEDQFQEKPWMNWPQVVFAKDLQNEITPFVLLADGVTNAQRPDISKISMSGQEEQVKPFSLVPIWIWICFLPCILKENLIFESIKEKLQS